MVRSKYRLLRTNRAKRKEKTTEENRMEGNTKLATVTVNGMNSPAKWQQQNGSESSTQHAVGKRYA